MSTRLKELTSQAHSLSPLVRAELVETILQSLEHVSPDIERQRLEASGRLDAYKRGEIKASDFDDILPKYERS